MIAALFFIVIVAIVAALKSNIWSGVLFSLGVFVSLLLLPIIVMLIVGFLIAPFTIGRDKRLEKKLGLAGSWQKNAKEGKILGNIIELIVFAVIIYVGFHAGHSFGWAALMGVALKLASDYTMGDTFFEYRRAKVSNNE